MQRDIVDELYSQAVKRYRNERPDFKFTNEFVDRLWYSIKGVLDHEGLESAKQYVETAKLL